MGVFEPAEEFLHAATGRPVRTRRAWSYHPTAQTAVATTRWEEAGREHTVVRRVERETQHHCFFPCEMRHLLTLVGFAVERVFGDFRGTLLEDSSEEMIWLATLPAWR
jgi:hypothetical protein